MDAFCQKIIDFVNHTDASAMGSRPQARQGRGCIFQVPVDHRLRWHMEAGFEQNGRRLVQSAIIMGRNLSDVAHATRW